LVFRCPSPTILVDQENVLNTLISKDQLKRSHRKLQNLGDLAFRHFEIREEAQQHLERFFHQHIVRWAMNGLRSQFLQTEAREFYRALVDEFDLSKELRFGALELNSRPIAYHFGFQNNGTLTWYKPAFDVNYWEHCPGDALLRSLFCYMRDAGLGEFDFSLGDEPFKYRYANHVRQNYTLYVEPGPARIGSRVRHIVRKAEDVVRRKPAWKAALKKSHLHDLPRYMQNLARACRTLKNYPRGWRSGWRWMWSRDEVLFYAAPISRSGPRVSGVEITAGTLHDIASLSVKYGYFLSAEELQAYRRLLRQGERLLIARSGSGEFVFWLGTRTRIEVPEIGSDCSLSLAEPAVVIRECWMVPRPDVRQIPADILRALVGYLAGNEIWICHLRGHGELDQVIEEAGFTLRGRLIRRTFLCCSRRAWLRASRAAVNDSQSKSAIEVAAGVS
jgi:hypothetical protein